VQGLANTLEELDRTIYMHRYLPLRLVAVAVEGSRDQKCRPFGNKEEVFAHVSRGSELSKNKAVLNFQQHCVKAQPELKPALSWAYYFSGRYVLHSNPLTTTHDINTSPTQFSNQIKRL